MGALHWPYQLPPFAQMDRLDVHMHDARITFKVGSGHFKTRQRYSKAPIVSRWTTIITGAQLEYLVRFYESDTKNGTLPFLKVEPLGDRPEWLLFDPDSPPPKLQLLKGGPPEIRWWRVWLSFVTAFR